LALIPATSPFNNMDESESVLSPATSTSSTTEAGDSPSRALGGGNPTNSPGPSLEVEAMWLYLSWKGKGGRLQHHRKTEGTEVNSSSPTSNWLPSDAISPVEGSTQPIIEELILPSQMAEDYGTSSGYIQLAQDSASPSSSITSESALGNAERHEDLRAWLAGLSVNLPSDSSSGSSTKEGGPQKDSGEQKRVGDGTQDTIGMSETSSGQQGIIEEFPLSMTGDEQRLEEDLSAYQWRSLPHLPIEAPGHSETTSVPSLDSGQSQSDSSSDSSGTIHSQPDIKSVTSHVSWGDVEMEESLEEEGLAGAAMAGGGMRN